jgi:hypothetical protein
MRVHVRKFEHDIDRQQRAEGDAKQAERTRICRGIELNERLS